MTDLLLTSFVSNDGQARAAELTAAQSALVVFPLPVG